MESSILITSCVTRSKAVNVFPIGLPQAPLVEKYMNILTERRASTQKRDCKMDQDGNRDDRR